MLFSTSFSFLGKNKGTEPLTKQVLEKIENSNKEIKIIKQKLKILNQG